MSNFTEHLSDSKYFLLIELEKYVQYFISYFWSLKGYNLKNSNEKTACSCRYVCAQSLLTLCDPMDCSPPGSSVLGIFQARILEQVTISFPRGSSGLRD